jgi:soluble lytic murein transglycosylase-like protein
LVILIECVAFGDDQVAAQVAQRVHRDRDLAGPIGSAGATQEGWNAWAGTLQDKDQGKGQIGRRALPAPSIARESGAVSHPDLHSSDLQDSVCLMIEAAGRAHGLPPEFFVRVIWQESRFRPDTVGPRRRNGESAQGIAQFMPSTAAERGLLDPFDPVQALPKAAQFLRELTDQFGSLGLAAAAYNAGPARVRAWLAGERKLSAETLNYVVAITGVPADEWARAGTRKPAVKTSPNCGELMALLQQPASPQGPRPPLRDEPVRSQDTQLAKNDPVAAPLVPLRGELGTPPETPSSRGDTAKQPVAAPLVSLRGELGTPPEAPSSRGGTAKQPASPPEPPPSSRDEPAQSPDTQLAKNGLVTATLGPGRADPQSLDQEPTSARSNTSLFMEKLTERVNLVADSPWGIQLSAGFSRERVLAAYATIASRYADILADRDASILSSVFHSRGTGTFYQIRVGTDTFESADNLCAEIRRAGGACMVLRNHS